jgi:homoserine kinase
MSKTFEIVVPGSIANLGAGFDTLAVAVQLYLRLRVKVLEGRGELNFRFVNQELKGENYIERAFRFLARQRNDCFPSLDVEVHTDIPMRAGLGSSAAATVAGLRLYEALTFPQPTQALLNAACALEGHPDNVSASLLGGLTDRCQLPDGSAYAARMPWPEELAFVVLTPEVPLATSEARKVLPTQVPRADAVFNVQRVALLLQVLQSGNYELLRQALADRLHQPFRQNLVPGLEKALNLEHDDLLGVCLSGAGPSIVAIAERNLNKIERLLASNYDSTGIPYQVRQLRVHVGNVEDDRPALAGACCA